MSNDLEIGAAIAMDDGDGAGETRRPGPCANCGTPVSDTYCGHCGQRAADLHRPFWTLIKNGLSDMFSLDGRLARTLPQLMLRPGKMTRNYLDGKRARYVPPIRLFLFTSIVFFLTIFTIGDRSGWFEGCSLVPNSNGGFQFSCGGDFEVKPLTDVEIAELRAKLNNPDLGDDVRAATLAEIENAELANNLSDMLLPDGRVNREKIRADAIKKMQEDGNETAENIAELDEAINRWSGIYENQDRIADRLKIWAPRFSLLFLPIFAVLLAIVYIWRRRFYMYDHVITAVHFQSFLYLFVAALILISYLTSLSAAILWIVGLMIPVFYLYRVLRRVYESGRITGSLRAVVLVFTSLIVLIALTVGLVLLSILGA